MAMLVVGDVLMPYGLIEFLREEKRRMGGMRKEGNRREGGVRERRERASGGRGGRRREETFGKSTFITRMNVSLFPVEKRRWPYLFGNVPIASFTYRNGICWRRWKSQDLGKFQLLFFIFPTFRSLVFI